MVPKLFTKYCYEKGNYSTFPMPKTIAQIRPDDRIRARESVNAIGSNFDTYAYTYLVF